MIIKKIITLIFYLNLINFSSQNTSDLCALCKCNSNQIKCELNRTNSILINVNQTVTRLDLSDNNLEYLKFNQNNIKQLILNNNKLKEINEAFFENLTHLNELDLSNNKIELLKENAFKNLHSTLFNFNLSLNINLKISRELCELISLKVLDLSNLNLANFSLKCWQSQSGQIEELYFKNSQNIDQSWSNWYPFIGNKLKVIDLTNSNLITIDSSLSKQPLLSLNLAHNKHIDQTVLFQLLNSDNLIGRLLSLNLANITASTSLTNLIDHSLNDSLNLEHLDISFNNFTDDLNAFLFNQPKFKSLKTFKASHNQFKQCEQKLITIRNSSLLNKLEMIDLSNNMLQGAKCLYSIKTADNLQSIDLSRNRLSLLPADLADLTGLFASMTNLSSIDLSHNSFIQLSFYFNPLHTKINKFDLSKNSLRSFRFISIHSRDSVKFPFNIDETNMDYEEEDDYAVVIDNKHDFENDDDERFIIIDKLDLSGNLFNRINLQHMLQSVRNIEYLNLSFNPITTVTRLSNERSIVKDDNTVDQDEFTEILCIDLIDFNNCEIERIPNLEHICINKLNFAYNQIDGNSHLLMSNFSIYFTDYINLQHNNITKLKVMLSKQQFKQDLFTKKNSPFSYHFGATNPYGLVHTFIDLQHNKMFQCDCNQIKILKETSFIQFLNECLNDTDFKQQCNEHPVTIYSLNKKFRILFVITCSLLLILSALIVYYICSDCVKNMQPYETIRINWKQIVNRFRDLEAKNSNDSSKVHYSKLQNDFANSTSNINIDL